MKRVEVPGGWRFITFSCNRRLPLLSNDTICQLFLESLDESRRKHGFQLFAWVIMPEHVHLLMQPRLDADLSDALLSLKLAVSKVVIARWRQLNAPILARITDSDGTPRYWQPGGGFDGNVRSLLEFCREVRYIHRNPVKRGLVEAPEHWRWSSVRWWMGEREGEFPCDPPPGKYERWNRWKGFV
jgi:putative transposase